MISFDVLYVSRSYLHLGYRMLIKLSKTQFPHQFLNVLQLLL